MLSWKTLIRSRRCSAKVILMSATVDAGKFSQYFHRVTEGKFVNAPIVEVPVAQPHSVRCYYLKDIKEIKFMSMFGSVNPTEPLLDKDCCKMAVRLIAAIDEHREINRYGRNDQYKSTSNCRGAVLVFLPGLAEIEYFHKMLDEFDQAAEQKNFWNILPLHSRITSEEQKKVFLLPDERTKHYRKIILSTNIAESSITVPDVIYVVDFCLTKLLVTDPQTNFCSLRTEWAPKTSCTQRKGRVGRVSEGVVYRMVDQHFFENCIPDDVTPEILRCPLEKAVLRIKLLDIGPPVKLLALLIDPPKMDNIVRTIATLKEMGALFPTVQGKFTAKDGDLSYLGLVVSKLPIDVHLGKLVMLGYVFNILDECIIMAAGLGSKNIFTSPYKQRLFAYHVKMKWAQGSFSDPITLLNAFQMYKSLAHSEHFKRSGQSEREREKRWARENFIQLRALKDMEKLVDEIGHRLRHIGIESVSGPNVLPLFDTEKALLLRVALSGAFYPNYFSRSAESGRIDERDAVKQLCGADPYSTVMLKNFYADQPPKAYVGQIRKHVQEILDLLPDESWNVQLTPDGQRIFVHFCQEGQPGVQQVSVPGRICLPVYLAVKQKQIGYTYTLKLITKDLAESYKNELEESAKRLLGVNDNESLLSGWSGQSDMPYVLQIPPPRLPELHENSFLVSVCHIEEPNHFWCLRMNEISKSEARQMDRIVGPQGSNLKPLDHRASPIRKGCLVMSPFATPGSNYCEFYRAKVISVNTARSSFATAKVYFIDYGNTDEVMIKDLRAVPDVLLSFPPLAFECTLTGVGPSLVLDPQGKWLPQAKLWFQELTLDKILECKVFSAVNGVISMDLIPEGGDRNGSLCQQIVSKGYAVRVEESFCSKEDNGNRKKASDAPQSSAGRLGREQALLKQRTEAAELVVMESNIIQMDSSEYSRPMWKHKDRHNFEIKLFGPYNPLELKMYGKVKALQGASVKVEDDSVNSVMLDDQPEDCHERILVAASVGTQVSGHRVLARATTLLPNIPGLPAILTLIFSPRAEFRANDTRTRLTGAICGLGYDRENDQSFYPEHDMELNFDTEIGLDDVELINRIRFWLNTVMGTPADSHHRTAPSTERMREVSLKSVRYLFQLIRKPRKNVQPTYSVNNKWNQVLPEHVLLADAPQNKLDTLIPQHDGIKLVKS